MPTYELTMSDGTTRRVTANSPQEAQAQVMSQARSQAAPRKLSATDADFLRDQRDSANKAAGAVRAADAFMSVNKKTNTGEAWGWPIIGDVLRTFSAPHQEMEGFTEGMIPGMKVPGSGSFTDADARSARKSVPNVANLGPANSGRAKFLRQNAQEYSDYVNFMEDWAQQRGNLLGAQKAWEATKARRQAPAPSPAQTQRQSQPAKGGNQSLKSKYGLE